jgi:hypothetical protein
MVDNIHGLRRGLHSFAPFGACMSDGGDYPRLAPWATFFRPFRGLHVYGGDYPRLTPWALFSCRYAARHVVRMGRNTAPGRQSGGRLGHRGRAGCPPDSRQDAGATLRSREAAQECSPRRKPWVGSEGKQAAERRKIVAHGVSRGSPIDQPPPPCYKSWFCIGLPAASSASNRRPLRCRTSDAAKLNTPVKPCSGSVFGTPAMRSPALFMRASGWCCSPGGSA